MLAETTEIFGAEHLLVRRARNRAVAEKLLGFVEGYKKYLARFEGSFDDNPSPGNKEGGLTNILEKSLGAVAKAGTTPLNDAIDYAERVTVPGFSFMNTPGHDPVSLTGLGAGGVNLIAFTTGRGSAIGFPTIPVLKIATQFRHVSPHEGQYGRQRRPHRGRRCDRGRSGPRNFRRSAPHRLGRTHSERTARASGIRSLAHRPGYVRTNS